MESLQSHLYSSKLGQFDWNFIGENGSDGLGNFHWYPARFVSQLPAILLARLTNAGATVLDPFCGSGTTLLEAVRAGRDAVGIDTNPVAAVISRSKLVSFDAGTFSAFRESLFGSIAAILASESRSEAILENVPNFQENSLWYEPQTLLQLAAIFSELENRQESKYYAVGLAAFSAILRYVCSQDKHWGWICDNVKPRKLIYRPALKSFEEKLGQWEAYHQSRLSAKPGVGSTASHRAETLVGECAKVLRRFEDYSFDAVITSPPYPGVTDYVRSQRLTFMWMPLDFDKSRGQESGARYKRHRNTARTEYIREMTESIEQIVRVTKKGGPICLVVGESRAREPVWAALEEVISGFDVSLEERITRELPRQRSLSSKNSEEEILVMRRC